MPDKNTDSQVTERPHSLEAEKSLLGGLMMAGHPVDEIMELITQEDFYFPQHQYIYEALLLLEQQKHPLDPVSVHEKLKDLGYAEECGGLEYLGELSHSLLGTGNLEGHANIIHQRSLQRQMYDTANWIATNSLHPAGKDCEQILDEAEQKLFRINESKKTQGPQLAGTFGQTVLKQIEEFSKSGSGITGLTTSFPSLDALTSGLHEGDLIIVAGRPGMGKTSFAMNLIESVVLQTEKAALVFSMEMSCEQLITRLFSSLGQVNQQHLRSGRINDYDWGAISEVLDKLGTLQLYLDDSQSLTPGEIRSRARKLARNLPNKIKLGAVMIDYIQLMHLNIGRVSENRVFEISEITRQLKALARELSVPVIALSQLNRSVETRNDKRPKMSDLRESGSIEQDADLIMFIHRDDYQNNESEFPGKADIIVAKHRNGPVGDITLKFENQYSRFKETGEFTPEPTYSGQMGDLA